MEKVGFLMGNIFLFVRRLHSNTNFRVREVKGFKRYIKKFNNGKI